MTDAGLAHLGKIASLTTLELAKTKVTDAGLKHLAGLKGLSHLTIEGSGVTPAAVASLESTMPELRVEPLRGVPGRRGEKRGVGNVRLKPDLLC